MSGCSCLPLLPRDSHPLTRLPACGAVFWGMGRETLYSTEAAELSMWKESHAALGMSGSCCDKGIGGVRGKLRTS